MMQWQRGNDCFNPKFGLLKVLTMSELPVFHFSRFNPKFGLLKVLTQVRQAATCHEGVFQSHIRAS